MFIESERFISTTSRRSKMRLQARRGKRLGRIAGFLRLMLRAFKCSFSTTGKCEPQPAVLSPGGWLLIRGVKIVKTDEEGSAMSAPKAVFVLIHGGWHNHSSWDRVTLLLKANGFA